MRVLGIDPGLNGGIAVITKDNDTMSYIQAIKTPIFSLKKGSKSKRFLDAYSILKTIMDFDPDHAFIEKQQPMPKQGVTSTFVTGLGYGIYLGILVTRGIAYTEVHPTTWKKSFGLSSNKEEARKRASELMPTASELWKLKSDDGVAEAALLAYYGMKSGSATEKILH